MSERDLFGAEIAEPDNNPVRLTSGGKTKRKPTKPKGYAFRPGTGPVGETCGTCAHKVRPSRRYLKCNLARGKWTGGPGSDILARSPACSGWEKRREAR